MCPPEQATFSIQSIRHRETANLSTAFLVTQEVFSQTLFHHQKPQGSNVSDAWGMLERAQTRTRCPYHLRSTSLTYRVFLPKKKRSLRSTGLPFFLSLGVCTRNYASISFCCFLSSLHSTKQTPYLQMSSSFLPRESLMSALTADRGESL